MWINNAQEAPRFPENDPIAVAAERALVDVEPLADLSSDNASLIVSDLALIDRRVDFGQMGRLETAMAEYDPAARLSGWRRVLANTVAAFDPADPLRLEEPIKRYTRHMRARHEVLPRVDMSVEAVHYTGQISIAGANVRFDETMPIYTVTASRSGLERSSPIPHTYAERYGGDGLPHRYISYRYIPPTGGIVRVANHHNTYSPQEIAGWLPFVNPNALDNEIIIAIAEKVADNPAE